MPGESEGLGSVVPGGVDEPPEGEGDALGSLVEVLDDGDGLESLGVGVVDAVASVDPVGEADALGDDEVDDGEALVVLEGELLALLDDVALGLAGVDVDGEVDGDGVASGVDVEGLTDGAEVDGDGEGSGRTLMRIGGGVGSGVATVGSGVGVLGVLGVCVLGVLGVDVEADGLGGAVAVLVLGLVDGTELDVLVLGLGDEVADEVGLLEVLGEVDDDGFVEGLADDDGVELPPPVGLADGVGSVIGASQVSAAGVASGVGVGTGFAHRITWDTGLSRPSSTLQPLSRMSLPAGQFIPG